MADKTLEMTLLFDFFGDLLTDKQREYFDYYYNDDLSLSEIAEITGISRQGVRDIIVRSENLLREYEERTGVVKRFQEMQRSLSELEARAMELTGITDGPAHEIAVELAEEIKKLKG
jgi:hypothetical protein